MCVCVCARARVCVCVCVCARACVRACINAICNAEHGANRVQALETRRRAIASLELLAWPATYCEAKNHRYRYVLYDLW